MGANLSLIAILLIHVLASAALFGAMFYSITVIQPRGKQFFEDAREFEEFTAFISNGARWKVLGGYGVILLSGVALVWLHRGEMSRAWVVLMAAKVFVLAVAVGFFLVVSWKWWPARIFATEKEIPKFQRLFRVVGFVMISLVATEFVLAIVAHVISH